MNPRMQPLADRFNEKWTPEPFSGCHLWTGVIGEDGYGKMKDCKRQVRAHRVSWQLRHGGIPDGLSVLHKCDTPICVNPDHLFVGTAKDNAIDAKLKGRLGDVRGENHGLARLTDVDIIAIRASTDSQKTLSRRFGVDPSHISNIIRRKNWGHI